MTKLQYIQSNHFLKILAVIIGYGLFWIGLSYYFYVDFTDLPLFIIGFIVSVIAFTSGILLRDGRADLGLPTVQQLSNNRLEKDTTDSLSIPVNVIQALQLANKGQLFVYQVSDPVDFTNLNDSHHLRISLSEQTAASVLQVVEGRVVLINPMDLQRLDKLWADGLQQANGQGVQCQYDIRLMDTTQATVNETWVFVRTQQCQSHCIYRGINIRVHSNQMLEQVASSESADHCVLDGSYLVNKGKMQALIRFADATVHQYNNIFSLIHGYVELMSGNLHESKKLLGYIGHIQAALSQSQTLGERVMVLSRRRKEDQSVVDFEEVLLEPLQSLKQKMPDTIQFDWNLLHIKAQVRLDSIQMAESLLALGQNAITAMNGKGVLRIFTEIIKFSPAEAQSLEVNPGEYVCLSMVDNGCGMNLEQLDYAFDPFYSNTNQKGVGLSKVYGFMQSCRGLVMIDTEEGQGTQVRLYFPLI